jgi:hypothetical protein
MGLYFGALVPLHKDSSVDEHPGLIVQLLGLYGSSSSCLEDLFYLVRGYPKGRKRGVSRDACSAASVLMGIGYGYVS